MRNPVVRPQETRGRWNSTDNVMQLGWSGSAVLGGFLLDRYSFNGTFLITASVQVCISLQSNHGLRHPTLLPSSVQFLTWLQDLWCMSNTGIQMRTARSGSALTRITRCPVSNHV